MQLAVSEGEAANISNYANLRLEIIVDSIGSGEQIQISQAFFECPDAVGLQDSSKGLSNSITLLRNSSRSLSSSITLLRDSSETISSSVTLKRDRSKSLSSSLSLLRDNSSTLSSSISLIKDSSDSLSSSVTIKKDGSKTLSSSFTISALNSASASLSNSFFVGRLVKSPTYVSMTRTTDGEVFEDNFDSETTGDDPSNWGISEGTDTDIDVDAVTYYGASGKSMRIYDPNGGTQAVASKSLGDLTSLVVEWYYYMDSEDTANIQMRVRDGGTSMVYLLDDGTNWEAYNDTTRTNLVTFNQDQWYHFRLTDFNFGSDTFDVYIDHTSRANNFAFYNGGSTSDLDEILFASTNAGVNDHYVDEVKVYKSEVITMNTLPTGWKFRIRKTGESVVATSAGATDGTATITLTALSDRPPYYDIQILNASNEVQYTDTTYQNDVWGGDVYNGTLSTKGDLSSSFTIITHSYKAISSSITLLRDRSKSLSSSCTLVRSASDSLSSSVRVVNKREYNLSSSITLLRDRSTSLSNSFTLLRDGSNSLSNSFTILRKKTIGLSNSFTLLRDGTYDLSSSFTILRDDSRNLSSSFTLIRDETKNLSDSFTLLRDGLKGLSSSFTLLRDGVKRLSSSFTLLRDKSKALSSSVRISWAWGQKNISSSFTVLRKKTIGLSSSVSVIRDELTSVNATLTVQSYDATLTEESYDATLTVQSYDATLTEE